MSVTFIAFESAIVLGSWIVNVPLSSASIVAVMVVVEEGSPCKAQKGAPPDIWYLISDVWRSNFAVLQSESLEDT